MLKQYVRFQTWKATRKVSKGQSLAEYALIMALISVVCIGVLTNIGTSVDAKLNEVNTALQ